MATKAKANGASAAGDVSIQDLTEQVNVLKNDISALTQALGNYTKEKGAEAVQTTQAKAEEIVASGTDALLETQKKAEDYARTQPATALGIAAGLGFLVGMLASRR